MWSWTIADNGSSLTPERVLINAAEYPNRATVYAVVTFALILLLYRYNRNGTQKLAPGIMVVGGHEKQSIRANRERFRENAKEMLEEGYRKVRGKNMTPCAVQLADQPQSHGGFYYVPSPLGERLMIPVKYLEELKTAPVEEVDFVATFIEVSLRQVCRTIMTWCLRNQMFEGKYTTMGSRSTLHPRVVKAQLNHHLGEYAGGGEIYDTYL